MNDFVSCKCNQLKIELAKRGAKTTGTKSVLVERLRAYDRNQDFSSASSFPALPEDLPMPMWPSEVFKSITRTHQALLPPLLFEHIQQYVIYRQGSDCQSVSDIKSLKKGKLVAENSVTALSWFQDENFSFFSGSVSASMKKRISYSVKIILEKSGEVRNSHCECPGSNYIKIFCIADTLSI